jgi:4'-phosphopantetheinyl transferase
MCGIGRILNLNEKGVEPALLDRIAAKRTQASEAVRAGSTTGRKAMITAASFTNHEIEVVLTRLVAGPETVRASAVVLSDAERQRASCFAFDRDRRRFIVARARLRQLLAVRLGVRPESVEFVYGAHGKPALARRFADSDLCFNVSHCDDLAAYALSYGRTVGIDIEAIRVIGNADDIAARYFSCRENATYCSLDPRDRLLGFFNCWTRKEAFLKALGDGLSMPLDHFDVSLAPGEPAKILRVENTPGDDFGWSLDSFVPAPGYVAAIASQR